MISVLLPRHMREVWMSRIALWDFLHFKDLHTSFIARSCLWLQWNVNSLSQNKCDTSYSHFDHFISVIFTVSIPIFTITSSLIKSWTHSLFYLVFFFSFVLYLSESPSHSKPEGVHTLTTIRLNLCVFFKKIKSLQNFTCWTEIVWQELKYSKNNGTSLHLLWAREYRRVKGI